MSIITVDTNIKDYEGKPVKYTYDSNINMKTTYDAIGFYQSQLGAIDNRVFSRKYGNIVYPEYIPVVTTDPETADSYTYYSFDAVTLGKFIGSNAKDLPESTLSLAEHTTKLFYGGNAFSYTLDELRKSAINRVPLDTTKASSSKRGFDEHAQRVAFFGDSERGITGLFNNDNIPTSNSTINWATATGDEIASDISTLMYSIVTKSKDVHIPNVLVIPQTHWMYLLRPMSEQNNMTILSYVMQNNPYTALTQKPLVIKQNFQLDEAGVSKNPRMMAYELNDDNLTMRMPIIWRSLTPQPDGLSLYVPAEYKFGGVAYRYPMSAAYRDFTA